MDTTRNMIYHAQSKKMSKLGYSENGGLFSFGANAVDLNRSRTT